MSSGSFTDVWMIIPALNEEEALAGVLAELSLFPGLRVIVCDNGSTDATAEVARSGGAMVVREDQRGYGRACLSAMDLARREGISSRELMIFLDADGSDDPSELPDLLAPIREGRADFVVGSRILGGAEEGSLTLAQRWGNTFAGFMIRLITGVHFTDLGPFRAIHWESLESLGMVDEAFGWTVEMQLKAASKGLRCEEIPVRYRRRAAGVSKVSGSIRGTVLASITILRILGRWLVLRH